MKLTTSAAASILMLSAVTAFAQQVGTTPAQSLPQYIFVVKTVPLKHLTSKEAMTLLAPYSQTPGGGVYEVSPNIRAVTIREVARIHDEMMTVLARYDREPASVTLNFQLISAEKSATRDPAVAGLDSLLRGVLKFTGYRLLNTSVASASEGGTISQTISADSVPLTLSVSVSDVRVDGAAASVHLVVDLRRAKPATFDRVVLSSTVLSTGVTVPIGQTVVLGTSSTDDNKALILTVRPQLATARR